MGNVFKLVNNAVGITNVAVAVEGFNLGVKLGADPQVLLDVLSKGTAQSFGLEAISPSFLSRDFSVEGSPVMRPFLKNLNLVTDVATEVGAPIPTSEVTLE